MILSEKTKKLVCVICFFLFAMGSGLISNRIYLKGMIPDEMLRSIILEDALKDIAFIIMLSVFEPLKVEYKKRTYYLIYIVDLFLIIYMIYSYSKLLSLL